jgi:hypothetical protein
MIDSKYSGRAVSLLALLPLMLTGLKAQNRVVPLKNWATPLYWQPNQAEREAASKASPQNAGAQLQISANGVSTNALTFVAVSPCRLVDTRGSAAGFTGDTPFSGPSLTAAATATFPVQSTTEQATTAPAPCGVIPSIALAYSLNVTVIPHASGVVDYISIWPAGGTQPTVSTLNDLQGQIVANAAIVPAGTPSGGVSVYNAGPAVTDVIIDMNGYFAAPSDFLGNLSVQSTSGNTLDATNTATSGAANGVFGSASSTSTYAAGVGGYEGATTGLVYGVAGLTYSTGTSAAGVAGTEGATTGQVYGVSGNASSTSANSAGVNGYEGAATGTVFGVMGGTASPQGAGVSGFNSSTGNSGYAVGVVGGTAASSGAGVQGNASVAGATGVSGYNSATSGYAVGVAGGTSSTNGAGVSGNSNVAGVFGTVGFNSATSGYAIGTEGASSSPGGVGVWAVNMACTDTGCTLVPGTAGQFQTATTGVLLQGIAGAAGANTGTATQVFLVDGHGNGTFAGNLNVSGTITGSTKNFRIDDPLDPNRKYLYHASIESSEMANIYSGNVVLDRRGEAVVDLPEWFEALNGEFRYQLTSIGRAARVFIAQEIQNHSFKIAGGRPGMKVSWQVTGVRHDAWAQAHPLQVEDEKPQH